MKKLTKYLLIISVGLFPFESFSSVDIEDFTELSIEQLMDIEVISVSKQAQSLSNSAAAIFVITQKDIQHTGVTSIPEALRMAPGISVARIDSNKWAISSRGFNDLYANKLLVLIDGRSIYSPTFSGVVWDVHDLLLEDVERIEVIRGPGATLWGSNAVNGIINIITKRADETNNLITLGAGNEEQAFFGGRLSAKISDDSHARFSIKAFKRDDFEHSELAASNDAWEKILGTFRIDSQFSESDSLTLSGGLTKNENESRVVLPSLTAPDFAEVLSGGEEKTNAYLFGAWTHKTSSDSGFSFQAYYDFFRIKSFVWDEHRDTLDLDFNQHFKLGDKQKLIWGVGYRYTYDINQPSRNAVKSPQRRGDNLFSAFIQDEINLIAERLWLTIGSKFEYNDYTGIEVQPSMRLFWSQSDEHKLWAAVSRAVRTPSRFEHDDTINAKVIPPAPPLLPLPLQVTFLGNKAFESEDLLSWEIGYRFIPSEMISVDITGFYNQYHHLRGDSASTPTFNGANLSSEVTFDNSQSRKTYGVELSTSWQVRDNWSLNLAYSFMGESTADVVTSIAPEHQFSIRSDLSLKDNIDFNLWFRFVDDSISVNAVLLDPKVVIDSYATLDARFAWQPRKNIELSIVGQNLLESKHIEDVDSGYSLPFVEIQRGIFGKISINF